MFDSMYRYANKRRACFLVNIRRARSGGYVLLLVLGALVLVVALVVGMGQWLRARMQDEYLALQHARREALVRGQLAAVLAKLQLDQHWLQRSSLGSSLPQGYEFWTPRPEPYRWRWREHLWDVYIHPMAWYPDINLLPEDVLQRLLQVLGVPQPQAQAAAARIVAKRQLLIPAGGISRYDSLLSLWNDEPTPWLGFDGSAAPPGFIWNISLGTRSVQTDPDHTPLAIYRALYNPPESRLQELEAARRRGPVSKAQEVAIIAGSAPPSVPSAPAVFPPTAVSAPAAWRVVLAPVPADSSPQPWLAADLRISAGRPSLQSHVFFYPR